VYKIGLTIHLRGWLIRGEFGGFLFAFNFVAIEIAYRVTAAPQFRVRRREGTKEVNMPKASIKLPDGTTVVIDGSSEEVAKILALYGGATDSANAPPATPQKRAKVKPAAKKEKDSPKKSKTATDSVDLAAIIETIKNCDQAEKIETQVLDKPGQVNRILLPLFIVHEHMDNAYSMTSGDISQITTDLGIPVQQPNASRTLSGTASKYVIGDKVRKKGQAVRYKLSRRGVQYFKKVLSGGTDGK
jgi:hypothetical protein